MGSRLLNSPVPSPLAKADFKSRQLDLSPTLWEAHSNHGANFLFFLVFSSSCSICFDFHFLLGDFRSALPHRLLLVLGDSNITYSFKSSVEFQKMHTCRRHLSMFCLLLLPAVSHVMSLGLCPSLCALLCTASLRRAQVWLLSCENHKHSCLNRMKLIPLSCDSLWVNVQGQAVTATWALLIFSLFIRLRRVHPCTVHILVQRGACGEGRTCFDPSKSKDAPITFFLKESLTLSPRLALILQSSCLSAGIAGVYHHAG
jgi:hypothetical protein